MNRYTKLQEGRYYGYNNAEFYFVTDKVSQSKMIKIIVKHYKEPVSWIKDRICEGGNEYALKRIAENPKGVVLILNKDTHELVKIIK